MIPDLRNMLIDDVMQRWHSTIAVFRHHNMACVGCLVAPLYTIAQAVAVYHLDLDEFVMELADAIQTSSEGEIA